MVSDAESDLKQIDTLKGYNIKLGGLFFDETQTQNITNVKQFIQRANAGLSEKKQLRTIYLESESNQFDRTQNAYQTDEFFLKNKVETILEKTDFKMTDKYWIAAKVIGQSNKKEAALHEEAYNYLTPEQVKRGKVI